MPRRNSHRLSSHDHGVGIILRPSSSLDITVSACKLWLSCLELRNKVISPSKIFI
ncbi:hypothetical protein PILCRDRAFT_828718 [Piloderma croceum F 1598]|uniref:Uncharacterized protein n=1 Tax=Piloderma croceum (strain F 1598) TaxID=765440 RepID=A0A0C3B987_PILCF|nr:hypothetical protein PILCRDRAFT_828718 [Piloderma croceum F 1598]